MKTKSTIIIGACLIVFSVILSSYVTKETMKNSRTEEYALVDVMIEGKVMYIRTTKGSSPTIEIKIEKAKVLDSDNFTPVIDVLNTLNEEGYELLNSSLAYDIRSSSGGAYGDRSNSFMMVKKIK